MTTTPDEVPVATRPEPHDDAPSTVIVPRVRGKFALFDTDDGGLHIAYRPEGQDTDEHFHVPGHVLKMAKMFSEGDMSPMEMMKNMMGMRGSEE